MITCRKYDSEKLIDKVWYDSSMIVYSECEDRLNETKVLKVTFKNGATYVYKDVDVNDYVMFVHGGLDGSNGKALNKHIKPKCEFERIEDADLKLLEEEKEQILKEQVEKEDSEQ